MSKTALVVIESSAKSAKLLQSLKAYDSSVTWRILATSGHVCDMPRKDLGIDIDTGTFAMTWRTSGAKSMRAIKKTAKEVDTVYLATDGDREGELIAHHVAKLLKLKQPDRLRIYEITEHGVKQAFKELGTIDQNLVAAAEARRALDRLIGYKISPYCWRGLGGGTSAGRVQSCVLAHVLERDLARRRHEPEKYHTVQVPIEGTKLTARSENFPSEKKAEKVRSKLKKAKLTHKTKERISEPPPPFHTASALSFFSRKLGTSTADSMKLLQRMYEGGLTTYCRTDSLRLSPGFIKEARAQITNSAPHFLSADVREFKSRNTAQGAHEALRPSKLSVVPSSPKVQAHDPQIRRAYSYIWARAVATQATPAIYEDTLWEWKDRKGRTLVSLTTTKTKNIGWHGPSMRMFWEEPHSIKGKPELDLKRINVSEGYTAPPPRLGSSEIINWMERKGVGRPATYAGILGKLRSYGNVSGHGVLNTSLRGEALTYYLDKMVPDLLDPKFTSDMERDLDRVALGKATYVEVMTKYWEWLQPKLSHTKLETKTKCDTCRKHYVVKVAKRLPPKLVCKCKGGPVVWAWGSSKRSFVPHTQSGLEGYCPKCRSTAGFTTVESPKFGVRAKCTSCKKLSNLETI